MSDHDDEPREDFGDLETRVENEQQEWNEIQEQEQTPQEAAADDGSDALIKKAEKAQTNYAKRIRDIFGDNAPQYDCPACNGLGLVWNVDEPQPELVHPDNLVACENCNGHGRVLTGSKVPENATTVCGRCNGTGFRVETPQPENVTPIVPNTGLTGVAAPTPVMGWQQPDGTFVPLGTPNAAGG
jgi:excinuclease UvrABC ATPase subunit